MYCAASRYCEESRSTAAAAFIWKARSSEGSGNFANVGFQPATPATLSIKDSTIQAGGYGVRVTNGGGDVGVLLDNVRLEGNEEGLVVVAGGTVSVRNSVVAVPGSSGIAVAGAAGVPLTATLDRVNDHRNGKRPHGRR